MSDLTTIIDRFNSRYNQYKQEMESCKKSGSVPVELALVIKELEWCISEVQSVYYSKVQRWEPVQLGDKCHFKKHKGKLWKEVIDVDPDYADWCIGNIPGFQFDETAHNYLVEKQDKPLWGSFSDHYDDLKRD